MKHGTTSRYASGCRCDECRAAVRDYQREWRERTGIPRAPRGLTCGLIGTYNSGCRCSLCREAARVARRRHREDERARAGYVSPAYDPAAFDRQLRQERRDASRVLV